MTHQRRVALVTGVGRQWSIGAGLALGLAADGWDLALAHWKPYDDRLGYDQGDDDPAAVAGSGLTSDHTADNLPYGASKGALDRVVVAAAVELADRGVRANVINPGPVDTGWMTDEIRALGTAQTPAGRLGTPTDTAHLVRFLLSEQGAWVNGQVLYSNGGFRTA